VIVVVDRGAAEHHAVYRALGGQGRVVLRAIRVVGGRLERRGERRIAERVSMKSVMSSI
jgi:hypothetical protein